MSEIKTLKQGSNAVQALIDAAKNVLAGGLDERTSEILSKALAEFNDNVVLTSWSMEDVLDISDKVTIEEARAALEYAAAIHVNYEGERQSLEDALNIVTRGGLDA